MPHYTVRRRSGGTNQMGRFVPSTPLGPISKTFVPAVDDQVNVEYPPAPRRDAAGGPACGARHGDNERALIRQWKILSGYLTLPGVVKVTIFIEAPTRPNYSHLASKRSCYSCFRSSHAPVVQDCQHHAALGAIEQDVFPLRAMLAPHWH